MVSSLGGFFRFPLITVISTCILLITRQFIYKTYLFFLVGKLYLHNHKDIPPKILNYYIHPIEFGMLYFLFFDT